MVPKVLIFLGMLFYSSILFAQRQNGAMEGTVKDGDGQAVPGVTITVSSPSLITGTSITVTDRSRVLPDASVNELTVLNITHLGDDSFPD